MFYGHRLQGLISSGRTRSGPPAAGENEPQGRGDRDRPNPMRVPIDSEACSDAREVRRRRGRGESRAGRSRGGCAREPPRFEPPGRDPGVDPGSTAVPPCRRLGFGVAGVPHRVSSHRLPRTGPLRAPRNSCAVHLRHRCELAPAPWPARDGERDPRPWPGRSPQGSGRSPAADGTT